jgi:hypothetical protein
MPPKKTSTGRAVKPVKKLQGDLGKRPQKNPPRAVTPPTPASLSPSDDDVDDLEVESQGTFAFKEVLMIKEEVQPVRPRKVRPASQRHRSPTPENYIARIPTRLTVKCSGTLVQTTKMVSMDFNLSYNDFNDFILPLIHNKAKERYDPLDFDPASLSLKYSIIPTTRVGTLSKKPLQLGDYCDFDDESDYIVLQDEIKNLLSQGRKSEQTLGKNTLILHATLIKSSDNARHRVTENDVATPTAPQRVVSS